MMLITLAQAKAQLRVTHDADDAEITEMIEAASAAVVSYLKSYADSFLDSSGNPTPIEGDSPSVIVGYVAPAQAIMACKIAVADLYKNREGQRDNAVPSEFGYGYPLPAAATALLYPLRTPTLA